MPSSIVIRSPRVATTPLPQRDGFDRYLAGMAEYPLMSAEDERARAIALGQLRRALWNTILDEPELARPMLVVVSRELDDEADRDELVDIRRTLVRATEPTGRGAVQAPEHLRSRQAERLAGLDRDLALSKRILDVLARDRSGEARRPEIDPGLDPLDRQVGAYRRRVRAAYVRVTKARNQFACANLRLVIAIARRSGRGQLSFEDRVQEGNIGLLVAIDRFDPGRGFRFSTYAAWWIRHAINRAVTERARLVRVPSHLHTLFIKSERAERRLTASLGRAPTVVELAAALEESPEKVDLARRSLRKRSISTDETGVADADGASLADVLADDANPDVGEALDERRNAVVARSAFGSLTNVEQSILVQRFALAGGSRISLHAIGGQLGVSRERIRQLQNAALAKLRGEIERSQLATCSVG